MDKKETKEKIETLIEKYEKVRNAGKARFYTEEETKKDFILPLFELLGWEIYNKSEVSAEESMSAGRVDYGFYLDDRIKFYLEAKKLNADLNNEEFANQAIRYSWNKGATWAVLTDFESLKVFNAQDIEKKLADKLFFEIPYNQYIERFSQLWLLSRESFKNNLLDKEAETYGKKFQRIPVTSLLYKDLQQCRDILTNELGQMNEKVKPDLLDEGVQKLLDRLIFIRVAEDRGTEPPTLIPLVRQARKGNKKMYESMVEKFREFDNFYNSNLFQPHSFEQWEEYSGVTEKVINILYGKAGYYEYDFKAMPADVLGAVYENYLGYRLSRSKKGATIAKDAKKRKEHGIYYTPSFIVDYIVKNTLGPILDKCKSVSDLKKIKVLDPACGSGSFLIRAMNLIVEKYKEFGFRGNEELVKIQILENNIYGVDLDQQAVEITQLNLLINSLNERMKLPLLDNIKYGNSLISGTDEELKKYFGANFRDKKPFNWQEELPQVFKQGGFDVIIGNPPYIDSEEMTKTQSDFREYCNDVYKSASGNWDLFCLFFERGLSLLKDGGQIGLIVPNKLVSAKYAEETRKLINKNKIIIIRDYSKIVVFGADVYPIVIIIQKGEPKDNFIKIITDTQKDIKQNILFDYKEGWSPVFAGNFGFEFIDKIIKKSQRLDEIFDVCGAATVGEAYEIKKLIKELYGEKKYFKFINTGTINRYISLWDKEKTQYIKNSYKRPVIEKESLKNLYPKRYKNSLSIKIIIAGMSKVLECFLDSNGEYLAGKSTSIIIADIEKLKLLMAILNSKLLTIVYSYMFKSLSLAGGYFRIGTPQIKSLPIILPEKEQKKELLKFIDKMLKLNKELQKTPENSNKWNSIKSEVEKTDKKIDQEVYKLYGLTPEEIKIIEDNK